MEKLRTRDPEAKRRRILTAALRRFARGGYEATSTAAVATDAGVSEGLLFHHFTSKEGLLEACGAEGIRELADAQLGLVGGAAPLDYRSMIEATFSWVADNAAFGRLWKRSDARIEAALTRGWRAAVIPPLTEALRREQAAGRVRPGDPAILAGFQFAVVGEALIGHFRGEMARARAVDEAVRIARAIAAPDGALRPGR